MQNLRKRVAATVYRENDQSPVINASYYSYDINGNVHTLWQQVGGLGLKKIRYEFDLVSGKVNAVGYQPDVPEESYFYKYEYDAENRLITVYSDKEAFTTLSFNIRLRKPKTDAVYKYYPHGPLARVELGTNKVQGIDYAYTLQGWLKGINGSRLSVNGNYAGDIGEDGKPGSVYAYSAIDVAGFTLGYYHGDYKPVNTTQTPAFALNFDNTPTGFGANLYNGNISHTTLALSKFNNGAPVGYTYKYDQLNRITGMQQHVLGQATTNWNNTTGSNPQLYAETYTYDANGNILTLNRNGNKPGNLLMDQLTYHYDKPGTNQLTHVNDQVAANTYTDAEAGDVENQTPNNYTYDQIGNMIGDASEGIGSIEWTVYGKIRKIEKTKNGVQTTIQYSYDAGGNRVRKDVTTGGSTTSTFYLRDAQGNVLALYESQTGGSVLKTEQHLYGSSRLGIFKPVQPGVVREHREYEITNHLGNVLAVISDEKTAIADANGLITYYEPQVLSQTDYYPFGMMMPGRRFTSETGYRYGFNGKENDNEAKGDGNQQDYGMRIYDPRLGRFLSVDPLEKKYPWYSPYHFAGNSPIRNIDLDGGEPKDRAKNYQYGIMGNSFKNAAYGDDIVMNVPKLGWMNVRTVIDITTKQVWFIASHPNNPSELYYYNADDGDHQTLHVERNKGDKMWTVTGGTFTPYKTPEQEEYELRVRTTNQLVNGFSTAFVGILSIGAAAPAIPSLVEGSLSERLASAGSDFFVQYASNISNLGFGKENIQNINITSVLANFVMPNADIVSSFMGTSLQYSYKEKGSKNLFGQDATPGNILFNSLVGAIGNKTSSGLDNIISTKAMNGGATPFLSKLATENFGNAAGAAIQQTVENDEN